MRDQFHKPPTGRTRTAGRITAAALLLAYVISFLIPAAVVPDGNTRESGWSVFLLCGEAAVGGNDSSVNWVGWRLWLPNPLFWAGMVGLLMGRFFPAALCGSSRHLPTLQRPP